MPAELFADFRAADGSVRGEVALGPGGFRTHVARPGERLVKVDDPDVVPTGRAIRAPGLWAEALVQQRGEHYTFDLEAFAVAVDDPADELGVRVPLGYELEWEVDAALEDGSYACKVFGEILIGDETLELAGSGVWAERPPA